MQRNVRLDILVCLLSTAFVIGSCSKHESAEDIARMSNDRVKWSMVLNDSASRAAIDTDGSGVFEEGDTIVVYARNLNDGSLKHYTVRLSNGEWEPAIYWSEIGREVQFTAWHAATAKRLHVASQSSSEYIHELAVNQQNDGYPVSDLLCAQASGRIGERVQLSFGHALSRLHVILESSDQTYDDLQLQQAEVQVCSPTAIPFDLSNGDMQTPSDYNWIIPAKKENAVWTALLCPQKAGDMSSDGWIRISINGEENVVKIPEAMNGKPFEGLMAGKEITYRLNVRKGETQGMFAGTTQWVYGVKKPIDEQWSADRSQLSWIEGCGWFDCNKVDPSDTSAGGDGLMCWAAATSNLIHWWLLQNRETEAVLAYNGPEAVPSDMLHSEIFQLYKNYFPNQGDYPLKGINWFFNGVFHRNIYDTDPVDSAAGFFREQLGVYSLGAEYVGTDMMRDRFNAIIKQALSSKQGILFVINMGKSWTTHAVTLWGVKFDEDGVIDTLYMVDNNDGRYDSRGTIRTMQVRYLPYSTSNSALYPYVPNSVGDFTMRIESVCTLSLGRELIR